MTEWAKCTTRSRTDFLQGCLAAMAFLTRIPVGAVGSAKGPQAWAPAYFPLVGASLGMLGCVTWHLTQPLSAAVRSWLVLAALMLSTGAFHEDGLADTADALGGAFNRERLFEILKDSRIGTFGAAALIVTLALKAELLTHLMPRVSALLVASQALSRLGPVLLLWRLPYVTASAQSRSGPFTTVRHLHLLVALLFNALIIAAVQHWVQLPLRVWVVAALAQGVATLWLAWRFTRRAGGVTGDFLGATQQISELALLLGVSWALH